MAHARFRTSQDFHQKNMKKIQEKLKGCVDQQSFKSLDKLENIFGAAQEQTLPETMDTTTDTVGIDAVEGTVKELKGENKAPVSKRSNRNRSKHGLKSAASQKKRQAEQPKRRPRFFVQF